MTEFSGQQESALRSIENWIENESDQVFYLAGYAGTGKTTLAKEAANMVNGKVMFGAFTGKAAQVMRRKGCGGASTIHSMIYTPAGAPSEDEDDKAPANDEPTFILDDNSKVRKAKLIVIDECSMIDEIMAKDLLSFGVKVLVIGDPAQLPPVKGAGYFTAGKPNFMLTEVHRQARDNPIIAMSMEIRAGKPFVIGDHGACRVISRKDVDPEQVLHADQVIVGLNKSRVGYNARIRELKHFQPNAPVKGEKLICLRNHRPKKLFNGSMWIVQKVKKKGTTYRMEVIDADYEMGDPAPKKVRVLEEFFTGDEAGLPWQAKMGTQEFTFGYAITCHKSQGSQWNNVMVFDESAAFREASIAWKYTAITRAAERLTVVIP